MILPPTLTKFVDRIFAHRWEFRFMKVRGYKISITLNLWWEQAIWPKYGIATF